MSDNASTPVRSSKNSGYFQAIQVGYTTGLTHKLSFTNSDQNILLTNPQCSLVSIFTTQDCWVRWNGTAGVADGVSYFCPGGIRDFIGVPVGLTAPALHVVRDTSNGDIHLAEAE